jgi:hypothetical protein
MTTPRTERDPRQLQIRAPLLRDQKNRTILSGTIFDSRAIRDQRLREKGARDGPAIRPDDFFRGIREIARVNSESQFSELSGPDSPMDCHTILLG